MCDSWRSIRKEFKDSSKQKDTLDRKVMTLICPSLTKYYTVCKSVGRAHSAPQIYITLNGHGLKQWRGEGEVWGIYAQCIIHTCMKMFLCNTIPCEMNIYNENHLIYYRRIDKVGF